MKEATFDIGPEQANKFNNTHRELHYYVQHKIKNGHETAQAIKDPQAPAYNMQPYPLMINTNPGDATASIPILEEEKGYVLYVWNHDQDAIWDSKKLNMCNCK